MERKKRKKKYNNITVIVENAPSDDVVNMARMLAYNMLKKENKNEQVRKGRCCV
jgi:hypothetical protein